MTIGVVISHPDDECLGPGGTLAKLARAGENISLLILGDGVTSRYGGALEMIEMLQPEDRCKQALQAALILGVNDIKFEGLPDNRFDELVLLDVVRRVEAWLEIARPTVVNTHSLADLNIDHQVTARAVLTATRPQPGQTVREVYAFETPSSTEWAFGQFGVFQPNVFVDITETMEVKLRALECYESEMRPYPHPRSPEAIRAIARRWGNVVGVPYAEAFQLSRSLR